MMIIPLLKNFQQKFFKSWTASKPVCFTFALTCKSNFNVKKLLGQSFFSSLTLLYLLTKWLRDSGLTVNEIPQDCSEVGELDNHPYFYQHNRY